MAITEAERLKQLAVVRRLEAVSFRAWPASTTFFDGTWAVRITGSFPAKRLNSVNPLDPSDNADLDSRLKRVARSFAEAGRTIVVRQSPLAAPELIAHLDSKRWSAFGESMVMTLDLSTLDTDEVIERIPIQDAARYVAASLAVHERPKALGTGLANILAGISPPKGMFLRQGEDGAPIAVALAIHDRDLAGLLDVAVAREARGHGLGRDLVLTALRYTRLKGAKTAWVQAEADNETGIGLYRSIGFKEAYRYIYRAPEGSSLR